MLGGAVPPSRKAALFHVPLRVGVAWEERSCSQVSLEKLIGPREPDLTSPEGQQGSSSSCSLPTQASSCCLGDLGGGPEPPVSPGLPSWGEVCLWEGTHFFGVSQGR